MAKTPASPDALSKLQSIAEELAATAPATLPHRAKVNRQAIGAVVELLERVMVGLDPVRDPASVFDPANPNTVGRFVGIALVAQDRHPLDSVAPFYGSGVYAIYYDGPFAPYRPIVGSENPIYVGKADPATAAAKSPREQEQKLSGRLKDHARTIRKATSSLDISHFTCRYLVVQSGWQVAAETYLINLFRPIWNDEMNIAYGIGKHGDAPETRANLRSPWDTMHPGRDWAHRDPKMKDARQKGQIESDIAKHFRLHSPFATVDSVLRQFYEDLKQR